MASVVNIQLGADENKISVETTPTFRLKIECTQVLERGKPVIYTWFAYYIHGIDHMLYRGWIGTMPVVNYKLQYFNHLKEFIQDMEKNKEYCTYLDILWNENKKIWTHGRGYNITYFPLCDDAKCQFIQELKEYLTVARCVYIKQIGIHPNIIARKLMSEL